MPAKKHRYDYLNGIANAQIDYLSLLRVTAARAGLEPDSAEITRTNVMDQNGFMSSTWNEDRLLNKKRTKAAQKKHNLRIDNFIDSQTETLFDNASESSGSSTPIEQSALKIVVKTYTDRDRERIKNRIEALPKQKQQEIGAIFYLGNVPLLNNHDQNTLIRLSSECITDEFMGFIDRFLEDIEKEVKDFIREDYDDLIEMLSSADQQGSELEGLITSESELNSDSNSNKAADEKAKKEEQDVAIE